MNGRIETSKGQRARIKGTKRSKGRSIESIESKDRIQGPINEVIS
jgi:hypothetical protein